MMNVFEAILTASDEQFRELIRKLAETPDTTRKSFRGIVKAAPDEPKSDCGANAQGGGGFQPGNTCATGEAGAATAGGSSAAQDNKPDGKNAWHTETNPIETLRNTGGFTYHPKTGKTPTEGFAVSIFPEQERVVDMDKVSMETVEKYRDSTKDAWGNDDSVYVGGWHNAQGDGKVYLDATKVFDSKEEAIAAGKEKGQLAGYDIKTGEVFEIQTAEERDAWMKRQVEIATNGIRQESAVPPPTGAGEYNPFVEQDGDGNGVTDAARVGVPAMAVPPPPEVPRLPNLNQEERHVEERFARTFESFPDEMANAYAEMVKNSDKPNTFETDAAKKLSSAWNDADLDKRAEKRARYNLSLHQTANAIAKRAFEKHVASLPAGSDILVTVGGCGAGKGYAQKNVPEVAPLAGAAGAVWDSAGDQNATENPWIQSLAEKHGHKVTYVFVHADPYVSWADPERGVVKRANDPSDGRMVDASVFADSYGIGGKNHFNFYNQNKNNPSAKFVFIDSTKGKPKLVSEFPKEAIQVDRKQLRDFAAATVANRQSVAPRVKRGALVGTRIWGGNE
jgi:hypothetical protein